LNQGSFAMEERPTPGAPTDGISDSSAQGPLADTFLGGKRYPDEALAAGPPPLPPPPATPAGSAPGRTFTLIVLPLALFLVGVAALAWLVQSLPGRGPRADSDQPGSGPVVAFVGKDTGSGAIEGKWEDVPKGKEDQVPYAAEYEIATGDRFDGGHYDFEFINPEGQDLEVGIDHTGCTCSKVLVCAFSEAEWDRYQKHKKANPDPVARSRENSEDGFPWKELTKHDTQGVVVSPKGKGVVRLFWDGRNKKEPERKPIRVKVWVNPPGKPSQRSVVPLAVLVAYVKPVRFYPKDLDAGVLSKDEKKSLHFYCWSSTRKLEVYALSPDPCFDVAVKLLDEKGRAALAQELRDKGIATRVRSGYRVDVTVHENKDGHRLDLGSFARSVPLEIKGDGDTLPDPKPVVRGRVQGEVRVGGADDQGVINLESFKKFLGKKVTARVWAKKGVKLAYDHCEPPEFNFKVELKELGKENVTGLVEWEVHLQVPPVPEAGAFPQDTVIVLITKADKRRIRIPVRGTAQH
jgi:hypothetical protein